MRSTATAEGKTRRRRHAVVAAVAALGVALGVALAIGARACGGSGSPAPAATVTVTVAPSASPSASLSPGSSAGATTAQLVVAVASGAHANGISVISATGRVKQIVPPSGGPISDLSWAPGGVRLAFLRAVSDTNSTSSLFVYNARRALLYQVGAGVSPATIDSYSWVGPTRLIESYFPLGAPTYHANGTLYLRDIAKSTGQVVKDSAGHVVKGVGVSASADGIRLAFVTYGAKTTGQIAESLRVYDANNLGLSTVASGQAPTEADGDQFTYPSISPDGTLVATQQTGSDIGFGITVYGVDGTKHLQSGALVWPAPVSWTPHGPRLALGGGPGSSSGEHDSLLVWPAGAAKATPIITGVKRPITSLAWTPKGSQIAYAVAQSSGLQSSLWIVNANGSNRHLLLSGGSWPAWAVAPIRFP
jgi:Tol biopolymer transport system component